jgi:hypothetical protein
MARKKYLQNQSIDSMDEIYREMARLTERVRELEHMFYKRHNYTHWLEPDFLNGVTQPDSTVDQFAYRLTGGIPDFKGHMDLSGASSPVHAFTIALDPDEMTVPGDIYGHTIVTDGVDFQSAMWFIDSTNGHFVVTWPSI